MSCPQHVYAVGILFSRILNSKPTSSLALRSFTSRHNFLTDARVSSAGLTPLGRLRILIVHANEDMLSTLSQVTERCVPRFHIRERRSACATLQRFSPLLHAQSMRCIGSQCLIHNQGVLTLFEDDTHVPGRCVHWKPPTVEGRKGQLIQGKETPMTIKPVTGFRTPTCCDLAIPVRKRFAWANSRKGGKSQSSVFPARSPHLLGTARTQLCRKQGSVGCQGY